MMSNRKNTYTSIVDVDTNAIGFVLGKGRINFNNLKKDYPEVKIWITQNGPLTTFNMSSHSTAKLDQCQTALEKLKYDGESIHYSILQRKRIAKNIESQRHAILAGKKIRDALEDEMRVKQRNEVESKIISKLQIDTTDKTDASTALQSHNMFGGLEVE